MTAPEMMAEIRIIHPDANVITSADGTRSKVYSGLIVLARGSTVDEAIRSAYVALIGESRKDKYDEDACPIS